MEITLIFVTSVSISLIVWYMIMKTYFFPRVKEFELKKALQPILFLHSFRFVGLAFLMPGVVGTDLNPAWALPAAYGDLTVAILAVVAISLRNHSSFRFFVWVFNILGILDLLVGSVLGPIYDIIPSLHAAYFPLIIYVPLLYVTHFSVFNMLLKNQAVNRVVQTVAA